MGSIVYVDLRCFWSAHSPLMMTFILNMNYDKALECYFPINPIGSTKGLFWSSTSTSNYRKPDCFHFIKGLLLFSFFSCSPHNIRQYKIASCKNIRSLEDNKSVITVHVFFCHSFNIYLQITYICTADRQAWLIHPQRGLFTEKCRIVPERK